MSCCRRGAPRRAGSTAVIGSALQASARGTGYRQIAAKLVGRCHRAALDSRRPRPRPRRVAAHPGIVWLARVDLDVINNLVPQATRLGDALTALAAAALTLRARVVPHVSPWTLVGQITCGRLVGPPVPAGQAEIRVLPGSWRAAPGASVTTADRRARPARGSVTTTAAPCRPAPPIYRFFSSS